MIQLSDEWGFAFCEVLEGVWKYGQTYARAGWKGKAILKGDQSISLVDENGKHFAMYEPSPDDILASDWCRVWIVAPKGEK